MELPGPRVGRFEAVLLESSEVILRTFSELISELRCFSSEFKIYFRPAGRSCGSRSRAGDFHSCFKS